MKTFTSSLFAVAAALSLVSAAPAAVAPQVAERGTPYVEVTLYGAAGASYTTNVYYGEETYTCKYHNPVVMTIFINFTL